VNIARALTTQAYEDLPRALFDLAPDPILLSDEELVITAVNQATIDVLGYTSLHLMGQSLFDLIHPDDQIQAIGLQQGTLTMQGQAQRALLRLRHKNGDWRIIEFVGHRLPGITGASSIVLYAHDVTSQTIQARLMQDAASLERLARTTLAAAYDDILEGWVRALDLRDKETEGHTRRVTTLTVRLARMMGCDEETLVHIRRGALLHDIGKLGIPDRILHKSGPLTNDEWLIMKRHPVYAYEWLAPISFLAPALDIPYCHHERWDGTGYPRGLRAHEIPLAARIFAVVDTWDALRSERSYKPAISGIEALALVGVQSGRQFDPDVVRAFLTMLVEEGR
jgi:PAS domain S-box-containing protein